MGSGQSNQAKANENNQQSDDRLKAQQQQQYTSGGQNMRNSKLQEQSNLNNLYDRDNPSSFRKNNQSSKVVQNQHSQYIDTHNMSFQQFSKVSNQLKQTLKKFPKTGQCKVGVSILRISPNSRFPSFTNLEQAESNYEASWSWKFDEKEKKWNFGLEEPQSTGVSFLINQAGQFVKGNPNQWVLLNQSISTSQPMIDKKTHIEQVTDLIEQHNSTNNHIDSFQDLQANRKKLYKEFNQEYVDRLVQFPVANQIQKKNNKNQFRDSNVHTIKKRFQAKSREWLMTVQISQNTSMFSCLMMWRADLKDKQQLVLQLLEEEKKLLQIRKQIYVRKMLDEKL